MTSTAGPGVDPMTAQGLTNKPQLQSRSPFISSLRESDLNQQRATQPANSAERQRQIFQPANPPRSFVTPYSMPPAFHGGHLPTNTAVEDDQLSSRGVLSLDSSGPQSHSSSSSHSSFTSGLSSYSGSSSIDPLINQSATVPPQGDTLLIQSNECQWQQIQCCRWACSTEQYWVEITGAGHCLPAHVALPTSVV